MVEQRLDRRLLALSRYLSADTLPFTHVVLADITFGPREAFHRLATTRRALVLESLHECPVDLGCLISAAFKGDHVTAERDFHIIDDEQQQSVLNERDEKARLVQEADDPGLPPNCPP